MRRGNHCPKRTSYLICEHTTVFTKKLETVYNTVKSRLFASYTLKKIGAETNRDNAL